MKKILILFILAFGFMSFTSNESVTSQTSINEDLSVENFDFKLDYIKDIACTATVTYNGEVRETFTFFASQSGGLANACTRARTAALMYILSQGGDTTGL
jgi:hypothetical protein